MKRTPLPPRKSPLRPSVASPPRAALPKANKARKAKREAAGEVYGPYHQWVGTLDCILRGSRDHICWGKVCGHHLLSVGAGGKDAGNEVPCCVGAHTAVHTIGPTSFEAFWRVHLADEAERVFEAWERT